MAQKYFCKMRVVNPDTG